MNTALFYPAPSGLPVPVNPSCGNREIFEALKEIDRERFPEVSSSELVRAGALWLHGFLDESHTIAQDSESMEGAYWHALMHRSEPDFSNSKYWYRKVGKHAIFPSLKTAVSRLKARDLKSEEVVKSLVASPEWDPHRFVDLVEQAARGRFRDHALIQEIASAEYNLLMGHCLGVGWFEERA